MIQDPNVERVIKRYTKPLEDKISDLKPELIKEHINPLKKEIDNLKEEINNLKAELNKQKHINKSCFWGHTWSKWEQYEYTIITKLGRGLETHQRRYCLKCNKMQDKLVD